MTTFWIWVLGYYVVYALVTFGVQVWIVRIAPNWVRRYLGMVALWSLIWPVFWVLFWRARPKGSKL